MANPVWKKIQGIINGYLKLGFQGPMIKKDGTDNDQLDIVGNNGVSDAKVNVALTKTKTIELLDADGSNKTSITQPDLSGDLNLRLPITMGNNGDHIATDGAGNLFFTGGGDAKDLSCYQATINYNTASPDNLVNMPANYLVKNIALEVVTPFDGTAPTLSVGIAGDVSRFVETADVDLLNAGTYLIDIEMTEAAAEQMIATINPDGATVGQVIITVAGVVPQAIV